MTFREMLQTDLDFVASHSISRGILSKRPAVVEWNYALEHEGKVLGIGGVALMTPTVAWFWIELTHYAGDHILTCYRVLKEWAEILAKDKGIKCGLAYVDCSFPEAIRTAEHLGFERKATLDQFIGDEPAYLFVRYFKWDQ